MKKSIFLGIALTLCGLWASPAFGQTKKESQVRPTTVETIPTKDNASDTQTKDETGTQTKDETVKPTKGNSTAVLQGRPKSKPKTGTVKPSNGTPKEQTTDVLQPKPKPKTGTVSNGNVGTNPRSNSGNNGVVLVPANDPKNQPKPTTQEVEDNDEEHGGGKSKCGVPGCTRPGRHEGFHKHEGHQHEGGKGDDHDNDDKQGKGKGKGKGKGHDEHGKGKGKGKNDD